MNNLSPQYRQKLLSEMGSQHYDLIVIGGGITGAGILLDAQSRGLSCLLIEKNDFASGTSSRSTKLVHGGLRYLKQFEFALVAEVGRERKIVYENGRHITRPEKMILPVIKNGSINLLGAKIGLWLYDFLANVKPEERRKMLTAKEINHIEPLLDKSQILGGALYYEYRTDDARLTIEIIKQAVQNGANALNYAQASGFVYEQNKIIGVEVYESLTNSVHKVRASQVVNASGPWVDSIDNYQLQAPKPKMIHTKGVHIVLDKSRMPITNALYFDVGDGRMVFAIPRENKVYIGTTDTSYNQSIEQPKTDLSDKTYLIEATQKLFPSLSLTLHDIESTWVGLRPMIKKGTKSTNAQISRKDEIFQYSSGLLTIAGGKLTGYRKMAERITDIVCKRYKGDKAIKPCSSSFIKISGGYFESEFDFENQISANVSYLSSLGIDSILCKHFAYRYGSNFTVFQEILKTNISNNLDESVQLSLLKADIKYGVHYEAVCTISDYFIRRTSFIYFNIQFLQKWKQQAEDYLNTLLSYTPAFQTQLHNTFENQLLEAIG